MIARALRFLIGCNYAVWHRVPKKNRRGAAHPCAGVAFYRRHRGPIPANEIPETCITCGQKLLLWHLDIHEVVEVVQATQKTPPSRLPRHHRAKGLPIVEERL